MIGIFDSGIGGLAIAQKIHQSLGWINLLYLSDSANNPYGEKEPDRVVAIARRNTDWLISQGVQVVVVACNTATVLALNVLRRQYPKMSFVGVVPAIKPACQQVRQGSKRYSVGVMATPNTIKSRIYSRLVDQFCPGETVVSIPAPELAEVIEQCGPNSAQARERLEQIFSANRLTLAAVDRLVLGCTHYTLMVETIRQHLPAKTRLIDSNQAVARQVVKLSQVKTRPSGSRGQVRFSVTGSHEPACRLARQFFPELAGCDRVRL